MQKSHGILENQLHEEFLKQITITEKLKLADELNQTLKRNIFEIFKDILSFQKLVFKSNE